MLTLIYPSLRQGTLKIRSCEARIALGVSHHRHDKSWKQKHSAASLSQKQSLCSLTWWLLLWFLLLKGYVLFSSLYRSVNCIQCHPAVEGDWGGGGSRNGRVEGEAAIQSFVVSTPIVLAIDLFFQVLRFSSQHSVLTGVDCGVGWPSMAG